MARRAATGERSSTTLTGIVDPEHAIGLHLNMVVVGPPTAEGVNPMEGLSETELAALGDMNHFREEETGYQAIQGTKPQTLGYGLTDSPAGLAGWIVEKFRTWSDCDGDVESSFTKDQLLTNITAYWVTNTIASSVRLYCESQRSRRFGPASEYVEVPTGAAIFPKELYRPPRGGRRRPSTSSSGPRCREGVTSPRWRSPSCSSTTSVPSSASSADAIPLRA